VDPAVFAVAGERGLIIIEDAAEAHGPTLNERRAGSRGRAGCFSFRGDKLLGVGTGGRVTTDEICRTARYSATVVAVSPGRQYLIAEKQAVP
jgi:dTDP-4-amino-4,6-dideoxygalactose transaminase